MGPGDGPSVIEREFNVELQSLSEVEFAKFAKLVDELAGIHLPPQKRGLLANRLRARLRALGLETFREYLDQWKKPDFIDSELPFFLSAVTTNETYFFRNERLWQVVQKDLIPRIVQRGPVTGWSVRVWSAAASSGEEAYTISILLREMLPEFERWRVTVIGTDISNKVLSKAKAAVYNSYAVSKIEPSRLKKWFDKDQDNFTLRDEIRKMVRFEFHNLRDAMKGGPFDIVFLRNVLMYFDTPMKQTVIKNCSNALKPGGTLFIGDVDPVRTTAELANCVDLEFGAPGFYNKPTISAENRTVTP